MIRANGSKRERRSEKPEREREREREKDRRELIEHSCGIYEEDSGTEDRARERRRARGSRTWREQGQPRAEEGGTTRGGGGRAW